MCGGVEDYINEEIGRIYRIIDYKGFAIGLRDFLEKKVIFEPEYIRRYIVSKFGKDAFAHNMMESVECLTEGNFNS